MPSDVFEALEQEYAAVDALLMSLDDDAWSTPSLCEGWTVSDVVLHLAQTEEGLLRSLGAGAIGDSFLDAGRQRGLQTIDDTAEGMIVVEADVPWKQRLDRWRHAHRGCLVGLRTADPEQTFTWATNPLRPRTLATTRLSEHWIHANDIAVPLGIDYPDTDRLWHIARLAWRTVPYAYRRANLGSAPSVRVELSGPSGETWAFGDDGPDVVVRGTASEFVRIAARRLDPADASTVVADGVKGAEVLSLVRTYA